LARLSLMTNPTRHDLPRLEGDPHLPRYRRVHDTFVRQIAAGTWQPGHGLPAEADIAKAYGMAPGTVRQAINDLVNKGLLERKHGLGTFIARPNFDNAMLRFFRFRDETGAAMIPESRVLLKEVCRADSTVKEKLALRDMSVIHLVRHRLWEGTTRLIEDIYLPHGPFAALVHTDVEEYGPLLYPAYERLCRQVVFSIEEDIAITDARENDAEVLGLAPEELIVRIERVARNAEGVPIEWRVSRAEARRFRYRLSEGSDTLA
jgi:GntR family transcriptional regulator